MFKIILVTALLSSSIMANSKDPVVATVNGEKIFKSELEKQYQESLLFVSNEKLTKEKVLDDMINKILGISKAKANNLQKDPVVKEKMEEVLYHAQISKDMESELKKIRVTESDLKKYYKDHKEFRTAHILFRTRAVPSVAEVKEAMKKSLEVYKNIKLKPETFSEMANKYSQSSTAPTGGDLGFQPAIRLAPEYYEAIRTKKPGDIVPPVRTQYGYHIIKVLAVKDYSSINKEAYKKLVYDAIRDQRLEKYFKSLQKGAKINIKSELLK